MAEELFYVVCVRHLRRKEIAVLFWGPNNQGYVTNLDKAGKYTRESGKDFFDNKDDIAVPVAQIDSMSVQMEYRVERQEWVPRRVVLNGPLFWELFGINEKRLHFSRGENGDLRYWRYPRVTA